MLAGRNYCQFIIFMSLWISAAISVPRKIEAREMKDGKVRIMENKFIQMAEWGGVDNKHDCSVHSGFFYPHGSSLAMASTSLCHEQNLQCCTWGSSKLWHAICQVAPNDREVRQLISHGSAKRSYRKEIKQIPKQGCRASSPKFDVTRSLVTRVGKLSLCPPCFIFAGTQQ